MIGEESAADIRDRAHGIRRRLVERSELQRRHRPDRFDAEKNRKQNAVLHRARVEQAREGGLLLRRIQQHDDEEEEHHDGACIDDDLRHRHEWRIEQHVEPRERTERGTERRADQQHPQGLPGDRDRGERQLDPELREDREQHRAEDGERELVRERVGACPRRGGGERERGHGGGPPYLAW